MLKKLVTDNNYAQIAALYALRALVPGNGHRQFITNDGFDDDDILELVGLEEHIHERWDDEAERLRPRQAYQALNDRLKELSCKGLKPKGPLFDNLRRLGARLGLTSVEQAIMALGILIDRFRPLSEACEYAYKANHGEYHGFIAVILNVPITAVKQALNRNSRLCQTGLLRPNTRMDSIGFDLLSGLAETLLQQQADVVAAFREYFRLAPTPTHEIDEFDYLGETGAHLQKYLQCALSDRARGCNVLIHGKPGVGKTELVRSLAAALNTHLYELSTEDEDGDPRSAGQRINILRLCHYLLAEQPKSLVLFDEAQDAFPSESLGFDLFFGPLPSRRSSGKAWVNQLLEENQVPTLWLTNDISGIAPAYLRRFDLVIEMKAPPLESRKRMLAQACDGMQVGQQWFQEMAAYDALTPAQIRQAARVARMIDGDTGELDAEKFMRDHISHKMRLQGEHPRRVKRRVDELLDYRLDLLNTNTNLSRAADRLKQVGEGSLLLYGPPGTGKTAFAYHLAETLGRELIKKTASDLLSKWVGETEQQIASMFAEASGGNAILLLDEADSFLHSRELANHSWEVRQVNEILVHMETFDGIFLCATNFLDITDSAALRRFDTKVRFDYLKAHQARSLFRDLLHRHQIKLTEEEAISVWPRLAQLHNLVPGDYAVVARLLHHHVDGETTAEEVLQLLEEESRLKPDGRRRSIGFVS